MDKRNAFEDYMKRIRQNIQDENPEEHILLTKKAVVPVNECDYCSGNKSIFEIPFSDTCIKVSADKLSVSCSCGFKVEKKVDFCPMCGRKIQHDN